MKFMLAFNVRSFSQTVPFVRLTNLIDLLRKARSIAHGDDDATIIINIFFLFLSSPRPRGERTHQLILACPVHSSSLVSSAQ